MKKTLLLAACAALLATAASASDLSNAIGKVEGNASVLIDGGIQAIEFNLKTQQFRIEKAIGTATKIEVKTAPVEWVQSKAVRWLADQGITIKTIR